VGKIRIGEFLVREGVITEEQLKKALEYQKEHPEVVFGKVVIELGFAADKDISKALKKIFRRG
jgi:hypothetical protein